VTKLGERCKLVIGVHEVLLGAIRHESSFSSSSTHTHELVARQSRLGVDDGRELTVEEGGEKREERREGETRETSGGMLLGSAGHTLAQTGAPQIIAWAVNLDPTGSAFACPLPQMKSAPSRTLAVPLVCLPHQVPALLPLALGLTHPHLRTTATATATLLTPTTSPDNYNHNHNQHPSLPRPAPSIRFGSISFC
jgi:hypothetical protein